MRSRLALYLLLWLQPAACNAAAWSRITSKIKKISANETTAVSFLLLSTPQHLNS